MDIKKLQTLVVDALEDVKAQEIRVFDTSHLTSLFDRVVVVSGTSNRQTKALAASVRDKVKSKGGHVISVEGEDTGEWVLVDLGDIIVHVMQPAIRAYYRLEEIWGDKEVKLGAAKRTGTSAAAKRIAAETGDAPAPKIRRTRAQAEAVEASQASLDDEDDAPKKSVRKPRTTSATGTSTRTTAARTTRTTTGTKSAAPKTTTTRTTGTKAATAKTTTTRTTGTKAAAPKTTTTRKTPAAKTPTGKTVRVAPAKSATAKKPAAKRTSKA